MCFCMCLIKRRSWCPQCTDFPILANFGAPIEPVSRAAIAKFTAFFTLDAWQQREKQTQTAPIHATHKTAPIACSSQTAQMLRRARDTPREMPFSRIFLSGSSFLTPGGATHACARMTWQEDESFDAVAQETKQHHTEKQQQLQD